MGYYDGRDLPFYWNLAEEYVLFDRFFAASAGGSAANHRLWLSGVFRRLDRRGISWKVYVQDHGADRGAEAVRMPLRGRPGRVRAGHAARSSAKVPVSTKKGAGKASGRERRRSLPSSTSP